MPIPRIDIWMLSLAMMILGASGVSAQNYPNKPIRIVTGDTGSGVDFTSRLIARGLSGNLSQSVIVENRGGSVVTAADLVAKSLPDGYTMLLFGSAFWLTPLMQDNVPYDPVKDFSPITLAVTSPNVLVVYPSLPVKSVKELIALAKARPGELNYGSGGTGGTGHLAAELFKAMAGVNIVRIAYKGSGAILIDLIAGRVQLAFTSPVELAPHLNSGRLRALAVTSAEPSALAPGLPTVADSGLPGYAWGSTYGMFAPAKTPLTLINRLNQEIVRALNRSDVKEGFLTAGVETVGSSPEQLAVAMKSEMAKMGKVIKDAGIRGE